MLDRQTFLDRVSAAINAEIPAEASRKSWFMREADELRKSADTLRNWAYGETECGGSDLLNLFARYGAEFERQVRGTEADLDPIAMIETAVKELKNNAHGKIVSIDGKVG